MKHIQYTTKKGVTKTKECVNYSITNSPHDLSCCMLTFLGAPTGIVNEKGGPIHELDGVVCGVTEFWEVEPTTKKADKRKRHD